MIGDIEQQGDQAEVAILVWQADGQWHVIGDTEHRRFERLDQASEYLDELCRRLPTAVIVQGASAKAEAEKAGGQ